MFKPSYNNLFCIFNGVKHVTRDVRALFELEVPEIYDGTVEIKAIAREAGCRTKVAVKSSDPNVDAVGACVGMRGSRVRAVVEELSGEKIDIVRWSDNPVELCAHALNPADILGMQVDPENGSIQVTVPQDQLSLAIGKRGQNARLASKLIGWSIDICGDGSPETVEDGEVEGGEVEGGEVEGGEVKDGEVEGGEVEGGEVEDGEVKDGEVEDGEVEGAPVEPGEEGEGGEEDSPAVVDEESKETGEEEAEMSAQAASPIAEESAE